MSEGVGRKAPLLRIAKEGIATVEEMKRSWSFGDVIVALEWLDLGDDLRRLHAEDAKEG